MKTPREWVLENTQSGAFDLVHDIEDAEELIAAVQKDVLETTCADLQRKIDAAVMEADVVLRNARAALAAAMTETPSKPS